jgi:3'-phosphoadenosine 5'-phosphosulfate sulfotransferase (PAPS reductase)/FAD synthetase
MLIGIMKSDSPDRRRAITDNFNSNKKDKIFPLANWNKLDILKFLKLYNIETSKIYQDRETKSGIKVCGVNGSGCEGCHFGNNEGHCFINHNGVKEKTTKFENLEREFPKKHKALMRMKHKSNLTYQEVLDNYEDAKHGNQLEESIIVRNNYINKIINYMELDDRDFTDAIKYIKTFIK